MSTRRYMPGADQTPIQYTRDGIAMCRWCKQPVPPKRHTFCSDACVVQWRMRTSPQFLRQMVLARDGGVCALCGLDTGSLAYQLRAARRVSQQHFVTLADAHGYSAKDAARALWHADHIIPVADGGGECDLSNLRTLCTPCHKKITASWRKKRKKHAE